MRGGRHGASSFCGMECLWYPSPTKPRRRARLVTQVSAGRASWRVTTTGGHRYRFGGKAPVACTPWLSAEGISVGGSQRDHFVETLAEACREGRRVGDRLRVEVDGDATGSVVGQHR